MRSYDYEEITTVYCNRYIAGPVEQNLDSEIPWFCNDVIFACKDNGIIPTMRHILVAARVLCGNKVKGMCYGPSLMNFDREPNIEELADLQDKNFANLEFNEGAWSRIERLKYRYKEETFKVVSLRPDLCREYDKKELQPIKPLERWKPFRIRARHEEHALIALSVLSVINSDQDYTKLRDELRTAYRDAETECMID